MTTVRLTELIDLSFLQEFQDNFALSVGMGSLTEDNDGNAITRPSRFCEFCTNIMRSTKVGRRRCQEADMLGIAEAIRTGRPAVYHCHAGLIDFVAPIILNGSSIGAIFGGQILTAAPNEEQCLKIAGEIGVDPDKYIAEIKKIPVIPEEKIQAAANVLFSVANTISKYAYQTLELREKNREIVLAYNRMDNVFNTMSDGVIIIDDKGIVRQVNLVVEEIFGKSGSALLNKSVIELAGSEASFVEGVFERQEAYNDIEIFNDASLGRLHCISSGRPIFDDQGMLAGGVILLRPIIKVHNLINRLSGAQAAFRLSDIIGQSPAILKTIQTASQAASCMSNVLIEGESGTGKEVFAQAIHNQSARRKGPFVAVNCGAIPRELIGSELFGYADGAFTGAKRGGRPGKFEFATGGTLFLDEIGDMPLELQVTLLRVLQERKLTRIGDNKLIPTDLRIICATNKNLAHEVEKGNFRQDLYYRFNVISIKIPPLRERREDILLIFNSILTKMANELGRTIKVDAEVYLLLEQYDWPGNVRELQNIAERAISVTEGDTIRLEHLPEFIIDNKGMSIQTSTTAKTDNLREPVKMKHNLSEQERQQIIDLLFQAKGNVSYVAKAMGVARSTVYRKMHQYNIFH
ncbi:Limonene hydroxylase [Sporomusa ovata DSM 2662]|uniref:Response regulator of zinc sigma-54-dependent two-component system n=1 Tax=Sporomusa ovata TaxID=2378 RepID=A0A0U1L1A5_9FIRM|nr:sigma 54-interacting transcriptional regulator [Sporomusa ovata]EQB24526.1 signal-transduction and transcriptional-control protein [Sporomusa ovata DSM 2662]CQR73466.1 Response regulator of zinc sigma-54-dependent two-component system [Sporomusa ovata]